MEGLGLPSGKALRRRGGPPRPHPSLSRPASCPCRPNVVPTRALPSLRSRHGRGSKLWGGGRKTRGESTIALPQADATAARVCDVRADGSDPPRRRRSMYNQLTMHDDIYEETAEKRPACQCLGVGKDVTESRGGEEKGLNAARQDVHAPGRPRAAARSGGSQLSLPALPQRAEGAQGDTPGGVRASGALAVRERSPTAPSLPPPSRCRAQSCGGRT